MKRIITTISLLIGVFCAVAQSPIRTISGNLTGTHNWSADTIYLLTGKVYLKSGGVLNIEPGTIIKGDKNTPGSALIVTRGAKINAIGTPTKPIVFTSSAPAGSRASGDWGGLVIAGNARVNLPGGVGIFEGGNLANPDGTVSDGQYGGLNDLDNSGTLKYVRIEFAGYQYQQNNELNSLTLGGVGSGTVIENVQCSYGLDDAFEFFGGTVNAKNLVSFRGNDDDFDTDFGYSGKIQFGVAIRDTAVADPVSGGNGFESDNDGSGSGNAPFTAPVFSNMTYIGPRQTSATTYVTSHKFGVHIRRNSRMSIFNSVISGAPVALKIDGDSCHNNADNGSLEVKNLVIAGAKTNFDSLAGTTPWGITAWYNTTGFDNIVYTANTDLGLTDPFNYANPKPWPSSGSPLLSGASFASSKLSGLTNVNFRGAFGADNWMADWTNFDPQNEPYVKGYGVNIQHDTKIEATINISPNPAKGKVYVSLQSSENQKLAIHLTDIFGKIITTQNTNGVYHNTSFDISNLTSGIYLIQISSETGKITRKLIIQ